MSAGKKKLTPRQRMINLMYIVLMAMLALNVSSDVLNGFTIVDSGLSRSTDNATKQNLAIFQDFEAQMAKNPEKVGEWYAKAKRVKELSDSAYNYAEELKVRMVREADGKKADVRNIKNKENLEAANFVMLAPGTGEGGKLYEVINNYRNQVVTMITDTVQQRIISDNFDTSVPQTENSLGKNWQQYNFENMPVAAAVTLLTKFQNDVRYAEGEILHDLIVNIDATDVRVNELSAYVIPTSQNVVRGNRFGARIIMAAVDTTQRPNIYINDKLVETENGWYEVPCNSTGDFTLNGYLELNDGSGETVRREFSQKYTVVDPIATVSASMMNVLYAGYDNPIAISVPGVPSNKVSARIANGNGTLRAVAGGFIAHPTKVGSDVVIAVSAEQNGRQMSMGEYTFRVRQLPDPTPFIEYKDDKGVTQRYRGGGTKLSKQALMSAEGIIAAIDDGLLNIGFRVISFETVTFDNMGNAMPELSNGANFSERQKNTFRRLTRGKRFYISSVKAVGPDGIERQLPSTLEVIIN